MNFNTLFSSLAPDANSLLLLLALTLLPLIFIAVIAAKDKNLPPHPRPIPILGHLLHLTSLPHRALARLASKHGPLMYLYFGHVPTLIASSAETAMELMRTHDVSFCDRARMAVSSVMAYDTQDLTFAPHGEMWRCLRRIAVEETLNMKKVRSYVRVREEEAALIMEGISRKDVVHVRDIALNFFNRIVHRMVFGRRGVGESEAVHARFVDIIAQATRTMASFCVEDFYPSMRWVSTLTGKSAKIRKSFVLVDDFLEEQLQANESDESEQNDQDPCLVKKLLLLQKDTSLGYPLSRDCIKGLLQDFMFGGTDTSAIVIVWAMSELVNNPIIMKKAQSEVRDLLGDRKLVQESDLDYLPYIKMVLKETLRVYPPTTFLIPRESIRDCNVLGYDIPARTRLLVNVWAISRDPKHWVEPERFIPERFEDGKVDNNGQFFEYLPFGAGRRMCPARTMALTAMELLLANLLRCYDWMPADGERVDMEEEVQLTLHRKNPLMLRPKAVVKF